jgi:hypothetical protein
VIWDRLVSGKQQGRLVFDFDFEQPWAGVGRNFVPPDFERKIEELVIKTFTRYYVNVDTSRFVFVWLISDTVKKWSKHLIVKHACFTSDWKTQSMTFYNLLLSIAEEERTFAIPSLEKLIDLQVPRTCANMRICGCSKIGGNVLKIDVVRCGSDGGGENTLEGKKEGGRENVKEDERENEKNITIHDTLIQLYRYQDVKAEQAIKDEHLAKDLLTKIFYDDPQKVMTSKFLKAACEKCYVDLSMYHEGNDKVISIEQMQDAFTMFCKHYKQHFSSPQNVFALGKLSLNIINLTRLRPAPCWLSGRVHDSEHAFLVVNDGGGVFFYCRRDCTDAEGNKGVQIFRFLD